MSVRVYTDGACSASGYGGFAAILVVDGTPVDGVYGGAKSTTNNQMELSGLIVGMRLLPTINMDRCKNCGVVELYHPMEAGVCEILGSIKRPVYPEAVIVSDSQYCVQGATHWVHGWKTNGWKTKQKQPVKNQALWEDVDKLTRLTTATFEWVKGHSGHDFNELADHWACAGKDAMYGQHLPDFLSKIPTIGDE
jgi:ribonuclease HI